LKNHTHENIVNYIGSEIIDDKFMIYLEYSSEGSLVTLYKQYGPLRESVIRSYTHQILKGLDYLHSNNIIHHDLKGANVLVDSGGYIRLSDFGCATVISNEIDDKQMISAIKGTIPWMAPEVIEQRGY
jgi:serine/threonine protein kinase